MICGRERKTNGLFFSKFKWYFWTTLVNYCSSLYFKVLWDQFVILYRRDRTQSGNMGKACCKCNHAMQTIWNALPIFTTSWRCCQKCVQYQKTKWVTKKWVIFESTCNWTCLFLILYTALLIISDYLWLCDS